MLKENTACIQTRVQKIKLKQMEIIKRHPSMRFKDLCLVLLILMLKDKVFATLLWDSARCAPDPEESVPEGVVDDIGRFPWMGVVQHNFYLSGKVRFAVTSGVLIHPLYALAPAEDMSRIHPETMSNNTKFILWYNKDVKYVLDVKEYTLHPEFVEQTTFASVALLELTTYGQIGLSDVKSPVLPICMSMAGAGTFTDLYAVKMTDIKGELAKEAYKVNFVEDKECEEFYYRAQLTYGKMKPVNPICAVVEQQSEPCVWDGGVALVSKQNWGYWRLIGFGVRGPGCGAPARFVYLPDYMDWIDAVISVVDLEGGEDLEDHKISFRRLSPIQLIMYKGDVKIPKDQGQCDRKSRGNVLFKESSEILATKNFVQGFYLVSVMQIAQFTCAMVALETTSRTNAAVWLEHHCHREITGLQPDMKGPDYRKLECFMYFKSNAFIEFRFFFSFRVNIELTLYGHEDVPKFVPNPFLSTDTTDAWEPTDPIRLRWRYFVPSMLSWWWL